MKVKLKSWSLTLIRPKSSLIREEISPSPPCSMRMSNRWPPQCLHDVQREGNNRSNPAALCISSHYLEKNTQKRNSGLRVDFSPFQAASVSVAQAALSCRDRVQDCLCVIIANVSCFIRSCLACCVTMRTRDLLFQPASFQLTKCVLTASSRTWEGLDLETKILQKWEYSRSKHLDSADLALF